MEILQNKYLRNGGGESMYSPEGSLASPSVGRTRKGADDNRYLWPQMLRAIREIRPTWVVGENVAGILTMVQPGAEVEVGGQASLFGEDYRKEYCTDKNMLSKPFVETLNVKDTPSNRYLFRLVPLEHRTEGTEFGLLQDLLPTPTAIDAGTGRMNKSLSPNAKERTTIAMAAKMGLLPTPMATDIRHEKRVKELKAAGGNTFHSRKMERRARTVLWIGWIFTDCCRPLRQATKYGNDQRTERWSEPDERFKTQYSSSIWEKFPTQSPICSGDDGLSGRLDGITFSKWRQESVKAYGNAIVPQVAYEIFKAIELCQ